MARRPPRRSRAGCWSTSAASPSRVSTPRSAASPATASAQVRSNPPAEHRQALEQPPHRRLEQVVAPGDRAAQRLLAFRQVRPRPSWQMSSRPSSRSWIAAGVRKRTRAAASSIASGTPPRWATIAATSAAFPSVTAKPGRTAPARATNSRTASNASERVGGLAPELGREALALERRDLVEVHRGREAGHGILLLAVDVQRGAARGEHRGASAGAGAARRCRSRPARTLLEVVEHEEGPAPVQLGRDHVHPWPRGILPDPDGRGDRAGDQRRIRDGGERHEPRPVGEAVRDRRRDLEREACLAGPAGPRERDEAGGLEERLRSSSSSRSRPTNVVSWSGRLLGRASRDRMGGKSFRQPLDDELLEPLRPEVLEAVRAERPEPRRRPGAHRATSPRAAADSEHLAARAPPTRPAPRDGRRGRRSSPSASSSPMPSGSPRARGSWAASGHGSAASARWASTPSRPRPPWAGTRRRTSRPRCRPRSRAGRDRRADERPVPLEHGRHAAVPSARPGGSTPRCR